VYIYIYIYTVFTHLICAPAYFAHPNFVTVARGLKIEYCKEQVSTNGRQLKHMDSCRVLWAKRQKDIYIETIDMACWLRGSGHLLHLVVSKVTGLFHFGNSRGCKL
jgi:hypothetical protein